MTKREVAEGSAGAPFDFAQGREAALSYDDIEHYQKITVGLGRTIMCMGRVDEIIDGYGGWPMK